MALKIKKEHADVVVAFNGGGKTPLGERSQADLNDLAIMSYSNPNLARFFDGEIPSLGDLQKAKLAGQKKAASENTENKASEKTPTTAVAATTKEEATK